MLDIWQEIKDGKIGRIQDLMQGVRLPEPDFQKKGIFTVMLKRHVESRVKNSLKIIELISQNIHITIPELADTLHQVLNTANFTIFYFLPNIQHLPYFAQFFV